MQSCHLIMPPDLGAARPFHWPCGREDRRICAYKNSGDPSAEPGVDGGWLGMRRTRAIATEGTKKIAIWTQAESMDCV